MLVHTERLVAGFRKVRQLHEYMRLYCIAGDRIPVCHREVHRAVIDSYGHPVEVHRMSAGGTWFRAFVLRAAQGSGRPHQVVVTTRQPPDWMRFSEVKEMCQIILDEPEDWSMDGLRTLGVYIYESSGPQPDSNGTQPSIAPAVAQSEEVAMLSAIELLYPFDNRVVDAAEVSSGKTTIAKLALHYDLPEPIIGRALNPRNMQLATKIWGLVDAVGAVRAAE